MPDKIYLLVCEGPTDIQVIDAIAEKISSKRSENIIIRELSPQRDSTTKRYPSHGWEDVRKWCKLYGDDDVSEQNPFWKMAKSKSWRSLVLASKAEGLIIQMDTDIAQFISDISPCFSGVTKNSRKKYCKQSILNWLGLDSIPDDVYFVLSTYATETWELSTHDRADPVFNDLSDMFDFEDISDVVDRLFTLGYKKYTDNTSGKEKLVKNLTIYKNYSSNIAANLIKVREECEEVENLCLRLES